MIIIVPGITHLAVLSLRLITKSHQVVVIDNGLHENDRTFLKKSLPEIQLFKIMTNRIFGQQMTDTHPEVLETLAYIPKLKVVLVDPDCFIFDSNIIDTLIKSLDTHFFASPFCYENKALNKSIPETFLLGINTIMLRKNRKKYAIRFGDSSPPKKLDLLFFEKWGIRKPWPQPFKKIFDTTHIHLLAGFIENMTVDHIDYDKELLFHVCGTSYNQSSLQFKGDNDFLILNAHYFHLKIIELLKDKWLCVYFEKLVNHYKSSAKLIRDFQDYDQSGYRRDIDKLIFKLSNHFSLKQII